MSQRSTKLLLRVAASCEVAANQNGAGRKLAGYESIAIGGRLFSDILTWARGYRAYRPTPDERALLDQANAGALEQCQRVREALRAADGRPPYTEAELEDLCAKYPTPKRYATCMDMGCPSVKAGSPEEALDMLRAALVRTAGELTVDDLWEE
jgi:hypothetical protein